MTWLPPTPVSPPAPVGPVESPAAPVLEPPVVVSVPVPVDPLAAKSLRTRTVSVSPPHAGATQPRRRKLIAQRSKSLHLPNKGASSIDEVHCLARARHDEVCAHLIAAIEPCRLRSEVFESEGNGSVESLIN